MKRFHASLLAALFATGSALAQTPPAPPPDHPDKAARPHRFADMCQDRLARATGEMAFLETKLNLSAEQKPLFDRWKKVKLAAAKSADCAPPPEGAPSLVDDLKREEKMLRQRLDQMKAEQPALEALFASLSDEQKKAFTPAHDQPPRGPHGDRPGADHPPGDRHGGDEHGDNEHGAPTPPPEN